MEDRVPTKPGRIKLTDDSGSVKYYYMERADEPTTEGTPLNKNTLFNGTNETLYGVPTPSEALEIIGGKIFDLNAAIIVQGSVSVATSAWVSDTTYTDYPYRASIPITGCTANHIPEVVFSLADALSGKFAPVAQTYAGGVYIYAREQPSADITIPTIKLTKVVE